MVRMLEGRVLVKPDPIPDRSPGGIIIPEQAKEPRIEGEILAIGPGKLLADGRRAPPDVKVGQRIIFGRYVGSEVAIEGVTYKVIFEDNIEAVYEG